MQIYNTMTKKKETFEPLEPGHVRMYVCGPTVYNLIHIGNARPMIVFDTVRRYFAYKGMDVSYVSNFTDVDDKIINEANAQGIDAGELAEHFIVECKKDMEALHVMPATVHPLATQEIPEMIELISTLIDNECSAMAKKYLGDSIDIHAGGEDLIFPHHENEIAQSEAANDVEFARYWMHNGFLNIDNKKMSKSLGNFFTVRDILAQYDPQVVRFFMLNAHYRSPLNFSRELM